jgi:hypothetical protein
MRRAFVLLLSCVIICFAVPGRAQTEAQLDKKYQTTKIVFTAPVEIPGRVLPAGTYLFTLVPGDPAHNLVQVWTADRTTLLATDLTVPDYSIHPAGEPTLKFDVQHSGEPDALRAWFYPGDNFGHEFVYPEDRAKDIASRSGRPVLAMSNDLARNITRPGASTQDSWVIAMEKANVEAISPSGQALDKSKAFETMSKGAQPTSAKPK